jgi:hypothetical protein
MESAATTTFSSSTSADGSAAPKTRLVDVPVTNQNEALQLIATFLNLAQKRGAFSLDESAKLWECIKMFQQ